LQVRALAVPSNPCGALAQLCLLSTPQEIKTKGVAIEHRPVAKSSTNACPKGMRSCGKNVCATAGFWGLSGCELFASTAAGAVC
jgi:hypothetical protein